MVGLTWDRDRRTASLYIDGRLRDRQTVRKEVANVSLHQGGSRWQFGLKADDGQPSFSGDVASIAVFKGVIKPHSFSSDS